MSGDVSGPKGASPAHALMATPLPPLRTGLGTYSLRILDTTRDIARWTVVCPSGSDPSCLPDGIDWHFLPEEGEDPDARIDEAIRGIPRGRRFYQLGNSPECFPVLEALYAHGGTAVFHELVLHHMLRYRYLARGDLEGYRRELLFDYGPSAAAIERSLSRPMDEDDYDLFLKGYPLIGRAIHACDRIVCLNRFSGRRLRARSGHRPVVEIGHPLSPLDRVERPPDDLVPGRPLVGMIGAGRPGRSIDMVVEAVSMLRERGFPSAGLALAGEGYAGRGRLPGFAISTGRLEEPLYQGWIREMDIVVDMRHPHCGETSGSLLEAMRAGKPCVVSCGGSFSWLPSGAVIRVASESGPEGLVAAMRKLLVSDSLRDEIGRRAAGYAEETGSRERLRRDWEGLLETGTGQVEPAAPGQGRRQRALCAAWHRPPPVGMSRDTSTAAVSWRFDTDSAVMLPIPADASPPVLVTAWGSGARMIAGKHVLDLAETPEVTRSESTRIGLEGSGWLTIASWR